jgi:hypothetical protein
MCWSYSVSVMFTSIELVLIMFIVIRSRVSADPFVRKQWLLLPALVSICAMEGIEAFVWSRPDDLVSTLQTATEMGACAKWNHRVTMFTWLFILPWQPLWVILPCRRVGSPDNRLLLQVPEFFAIVLAVIHSLLFLMVALFPHELGSAALHTSLADSNFKSYLHKETCTYLGATGHHLHWCISTADTYLTPNAFTYFLLWSSVAFAKPKRFAGGVFLFVLGMFLLQLAYFEGSWEAGSVWCWSAMVLFLYFALQPYLLPCVAPALVKEEYMHPFSASSAEPLLVAGHKP